MSQLPSLEQATIDAVLGHASRVTLPFQRANRPGPYATAFWFNELVASDGDDETVRQYLVTAAEQTHMELAEVTIRPELCDPAPSAEKLVMTSFAQGWTHLDGLGVAVMPTGGLHTYADRKGWRWRTDEITDGIAARAEDIARITAEPITAYVLAHDVGAEGERDQAVVVGALARAADGTIRWSTELPQGCVGAPVFFGLRLEGDSFKLVCAGVALAADDHGFGHHPVATFDRIRAALGTAVAPRERRRWWHRRS
ncbi:hypothetical protein [Streptomyces sp. NPDC001410]|uniref:hypothetical protein n=1 Tax=Streptomyces sp. NPDC001410 TaxID=3364574 RepID=UPI0036AB557A